MKRIVIVDDSSLARSFVRRSLAIVLHEPAEFVEAENGSVALEIMKENPPDLLVTDLVMPIMDGSELLRRMISSPILHGTPSIVITSLLNPARKKELEERGVTAILGKPVCPSELEAAVNKAFGEEHNDENTDGFGA